MLVRCSCEHCAERIEFEADDLTEENCIVACPHCGLDTKLAIDREGPLPIPEDAGGKVFNDLGEELEFLESLKAKPPAEAMAAYRAYSKANKGTWECRQKEMHDMVTRLTASVRKDETTAKIRWRNDEMELDSDRIIIRRRGMANALAVGLNGERTILISTLTAIQMKPAGLFSPGYILFSYAGSKPFLGGVIEATQDPDAFIFDPASNDQVAAFKAKVEKIMRDSRQSATASNSPATLGDELRKLAELKQQGILSQEEFDMAKKKLLA
jgi:hypothetical protein